MARASYRPPGHSSSGSSGAPIHLIIDTDMSTNADDAGALAIANAAIDNGRIDLLGVMVDSPSVWGAPAVDAINTYYAHGDIPIGTRTPTDSSSTPWAKHVAQAFPNSLRSGRDAPDAIDLYRKLLAGQPDHSVTIAATGSSANLTDLLRSGPDKYSDLNGRDLVAKKVAQLVVSDRSDATLGDSHALSSTQQIIDGWPTPVVFDSGEVGARVVTGARLFSHTPAANPVRAAYQLAAGSGHGLGSWAATNIYFVSYGTDKLFTLTDSARARQTRQAVRDYGSTSTHAHQYLVPIADSDTIARALSDLMIQPPVHGPHAPKLGNAPVNLIVDTDIYSDVDDAGELAMVNAAYDSGLVNLLGVMVDTPSKWGAPAVDAINTYYGHDNVPVGTLKPNNNDAWSKNYAQYLAQHFPNSIRSGTRAPDAVTLYRKILAAQPDHSVTIWALGFETNLANLLNSKPDFYSPLSGYNLVRKKVKQLSVMGGTWNYGKVSAPLIERSPVRSAAQNAINSWPTRMLVNDESGGPYAYTGARLFTQTPVNNPVRAAYDIYVGFGNSRNSWHSEILYYDLYGSDGISKLTGGVGSEYVYTDGSNSYIRAPDKDQNMVVPASTPATFARALSDLMVQPPRIGPNGPN